MKRLYTILCVVLAVALAGTGCEKKGEEETAPETPETKEAAKAEAPEKAEGEKPAEEKPAEAAAPASDDPAMKLVDAAIQARGGIEKVKAAANWTGKSKGVYMGMPYTSTNTYQAGHMRMDVDMPDGSVMSMVSGKEHCWSQTGKVVVPCSKTQKKANALMTTNEEASQLFPLKEKGWELAASKQDHAGKPHDKLTVKRADVGYEGEILFDPDSHLMVQATYKGFMMDQEGTFVASFLQNKEFCGAKVPAKFKVTFDGKPWLQEEHTEINCGAVEPSVFAQPEQVADGTVEQKQTTPATVACVTMKGPYKGSAKAMGQLMTLIKKNKLGPMGAPIMVYLKGPPRVKKPRKFVTEVCLPVGAPPPKKPKKMGKLTLKAMKPATVLSMYGIGPYDKKSGPLATKLMKEAMKRKLKAIGPMRQISYMDPKEQPADTLVSEMQIPIKAKKIKKKAKKGKKRPTIKPKKK